MGKWKATQLNLFTGEPEKPAKKRSARPSKRYQCPYCGGHPQVRDGLVVQHTDPPDGTPPWVWCEGGKQAPVL